MIRLQDAGMKYESGAFRRRVVDAFRHVTLEMKPGETLGLVGESGSGKSTLGRCIAGLERLKSGRIWMEEPGDEAVLEPGGKDWHSRVQYIYQDPIDALNPRLTVEKIVSEPLYHQGSGSRAGWRDLAAHYLELVGLPQEMLQRFPGELSRGQCQRVNLARALVKEPQYLICDEIISALDVTLGTQIVKLLIQLQQRHGYGYLFISHDLARVIQVSHRVAVMYNGEIVEIADGPTFHRTAGHSYSRQLLASVPSI